MRIFTSDNNDTAIPMTATWAAKMSLKGTFWHLSTLVLVAYSWHFVSADKETWMGFVFNAILAMPFVLAGLCSLAMSLQHVFAPTAFLLALRRPDVRRHFAQLLRSAAMEPFESNDQTWRDKSLGHILRASRAPSALFLVFNLTASRLQTTTCFAQHQNDTTQPARTSVLRTESTFRIENASLLTQALFFLSKNDSFSIDVKLVFPTNSEPGGSAHERLQFAADIEGHAQRLDPTLP